MKGTSSSALMGRLRAMAQTAAERHGLDSDLFAALIQQESGWNAKARSSVGALGLGQLMPGTAKALGVSNPFDPQQNLDASARYLKQQMDQFGGDPSLALAAYNAGPAAVHKFGGVPPFEETQKYVSKILGAVRQPQGGGQDYGLDLSPILGKSTAAPTQPPAAQGQDYGLDLSPILGKQHSPVRVTELQQHTKANLGGLKPALQTALGSAADELSKQGIDIGPLITSAFRSTADQARLYANRANNPNPVARPGHSAHESGGAIDIAVHHLPADLQQTVISTLNQYGLHRPVANDPVHWTLANAKGTGSTPQAGYGLDLSAILPRQ